MSDDKFIFLNNDSEPEKFQSVSKEEAIEEEDRLTKMMDRYFQNMNMDEPIQDTQGVDQPIMGQSLTEDEEAISKPVDKIIALATFDNILL